MRYRSTRSEADEKSFAEIILEGLAPDGGLYVPVSIPKIDYETLESFQYLSYSELAMEIISLFVGDAIPEADLKKIIEKSYTVELFNSKQIVPITPLSETLYLQDLSSGPSLAFKDMAMQFLGNLLEYILETEDKQLCILGASSGDTVSAAEEAVKGKSRIDIVMLTPKEGMSPFQKAQAGSILEENVYNLSLPLDFDGCQDIVKAINRDLDFKAEHNIGAVNSINWGRILAQMVYYVSAYLQVSRNWEGEIDVAVPTGNFGNILAAYYAKQLGIPIRRLILATNENNVLDTFFKTGVYAQEAVEITSSPSMDISKASNLERLLFDLFDKNSKELNAKISQFESTKTLDLSDHLETLKGMGFCSDTATHEDRQEIIEKIYDDTGIVIDPHTAAGVKAAMVYENDGVPIICMETAKACKFEETVEEALGIPPQRPFNFQNIEDKEQRFYDLDGTEEAVKNFIKKRQ